MEVLLAFAKAYADLYKKTRGFEQAHIDDYAEQVAIVATIDTFKIRLGYEEWTIEEFLKLLDIHLDEKPVWDKVIVTDLTGDFGLHYDVKIEIPGEDYIHIKGSSDRNAKNEWSFQISSGPEQNLYIKNMTSYEPDTNPVTAWSFWSDPEGLNPQINAICKWEEI